MLGTWLSVMLIVAAARALSDNEEVDYSHLDFRPFNWEAGPGNSCVRGSWIDDRSFAFIANAMDNASSVRGE